MQSRPDAWMNRREALALICVVLGSGQTNASSVRAAVNQESAVMTVTCFIRYQIDPSQR